MAANTLLHEYAFDTRSRELSGDRIVHPRQRPDGNSVKRVDTEITLVDQFFESLDSHHVQPASYFGEASGPIMLEIRPPTNEGILTEYQMGPGKN